MTSRSQSVDREIVAELCRDARQSNVAIARRVGLTEGAVRRRIDNLVAAGAIRFTAAVDPSFFGNDAHALLRIRCAPHLVDEVLGELSCVPELERLYLCTGPFDITAVGHFASTAALREFQLGRLGTIGGVVEIQSDVILQVVESMHEREPDELDEDATGEPVDEPASSGATT